MFINFETDQITSHITADICIIGAGAAGISIARELDGSDLSICLIEGGDFEYNQQTQALNKAENTGLNYPSLESTRLRFFGGTTNHWAGQSIPLDPIDFTKRDWVSDSGWPISYDEYIKYLTRAQQVCLLGNTSFNWSKWKDSLSFPLDESKFDPMLLKYPSPITRFGPQYRSQIEKSTNIQCILNANATHINLADEHIIKDIDIKSLNGKSSKVSAKKFILACGAIQNVKLLLNSKDKNGTAIGNKNGLVGKYFMEHPNYDTGKIELKENKLFPFLSKPRTQVNSVELRTDFRLNETLQQKHKILNHTMFLVPKGDEEYSDDLMGKAASFWHKVENKIAHYLDIDNTTMALRVRLEHAPYENSKITLASSKDELGLYDVKVHFAIGDLETRTISVLENILATELGISDVGRMKIDFDSSNRKWADHVGWQFHHLGGTRMSQSPKQGVVDENCKVHGTDNLYISSSSVFPTSGQANPTMNIVAFALRLADHIKKDMSHEI